MARFVLVHGSGQNATCWERVAAILRGRGHDVAAPDLPKAPERDTLDGHARRIAAAVPGADAIVVAHSLSGIFLPLVPAHAACRQLVFLAAVLPEARRSVREQLEADPSMFDAAWLAAGARWFDPAEREALGREFLFHDCAATDLPAALATLEPMETRQLVLEPSPAPAPPPDAAHAPGTRPPVSVVATEDRTLSPAWIRRATRRLLRADPLEIRSGHCPQQSRPADLAGLLEAIAEERDR